MHKTPKILINKIENKTREKKIYPSLVQTRFRASQAQPAIEPNRTEPNRTGPALTYIGLVRPATRSDQTELRQDDSVRIDDVALIASQRAVHTASNSFPSYISPSSSSPLHLQRIPWSSLSFPFLSPSLSCAASCTVLLQLVCFS